MGKYISCGKCEKNYCFINLANLINNIVINIFIYSFIKCNKSTEDLENNHGIFLYAFLSYIGQIFFTNLF